MNNREKKDPPQWAVDNAIVNSIGSPCFKSKRGVVIFSETLLSNGCNSPPKGYICDGSKTCQDSCAKLCRHAEMESLCKLGGNKSNRLNMLHVKTKKGLLVPSKEPSCWQCSREIINDPRISWFWLYHEDGWYRYPIQLFHELTLKKCKLPILPS